MSDPTNPHGYPPGLYVGDRQLPQAWPQPQPYDPRGAWTNPQGTVPGPSPKTWPKAYWVANPMSLTWAAGAVPVTRTATWRSPVFDFRPELRHADVPRASAIPIYRSGGGGHLYVQIFGITEQQHNLTTLEVLASEFGNVWSAEQQGAQGNPANVPRITEPEDVTDQLFADVPSAILVFDPPGGGYHVRYWSLALSFSVFSVQPSDPNFRIAAGVY